MKLEGVKGGLKRKERKILGGKETNLYFALLLVLVHLHVLNMGFLSHFSFLKTLISSFLRHLCLQFLYPTNLDKLPSGRNLVHDIKLVAPPPLVPFTELDPMQLLTASFIDVA